MNKTVFVSLFGLFISEAVLHQIIKKLINSHTPTGGTTRPLSLFVVPCASKGNTTSSTDPAEKYDNTQLHV